MTLRCQALLLMILLAFAALWPANAGARESCPPLNAASSSDRDAINHHLCFYAAQPGDAAHSTHSPAELPAELSWQSAGGNDLVFSQTDSVYWVRLVLQNRGDQQKHWFLKLNYPLLDQVTFWQQSLNKNQSTPPQNRTPSLKTGDRYPFASRNIDYRYFLLPVTLNPSEIIAVTIRIQSTGALNVPLAIMTPAELIEESNHLTLVHGLFYGALLTLAAFNLMLYASSGTRYYFFNAFYTLSMGMFLFAMGGFANQYFWPDSITLANLSIPLTLASCALAMILFGRSFLEIAPDTFSNWTLNSLAWIVAGFLVATPLLPYSHSILFNTGIGLITLIILMVVATIRWRQGYQPALWYISAWLIMVIGAITYASAAFGYLGDFLAREVMMQIGVGAQVILLNYAMVQRWRLLNQRLLEVEHSARCQMELRVHERTAQLRSTMRELEQANQKLESLTLNDALTDLFNRRHMDNLLPELCREARRTGNPITLALLDADHFKRINDSWGHEFGDHCLRRIADCLKQHAKRPRDVAVRFGGEEFALLLPETDGSGAERLCQEILDYLRNTAIISPTGEQLKLTLSAGIAVLRAGETPSDLFQAADTALYESKASGRDKVTVRPQQLLININY